VSGALSGSLELSFEYLKTADKLQWITCVPLKYVWACAWLPAIMFISFTIVLTHTLSSFRRRKSLPSPCLAYMRRIKSANVIHLSMTLQFMVDEMMRVRQGSLIRRPADRERCGCALC
jgi:hypothetical protein